MSVTTPRASSSPRPVVTPAAPVVVPQGVPTVVPTVVPAVGGRVRHRAGSDTSRWLVPVVVVGLALVATVCAVTVLGLLAARFG